MVYLFIAPIVLIVLFLLYAAITKNKELSSSWNVLLRNYMIGAVILIMGMCVLFALIYSTLPQQ